MDYFKLVVLIPEDFLDIVIENLIACGVILKSPYAGLTDSEYLEFLRFISKSRW